MFGGVRAEPRGTRNGVLALSVTASSAFEPNPAGPEIPVEKRISENSSTFEPNRDGLGTGDETRSSTDESGFERNPAGLETWPRGCCRSRRDTGFERNPPGPETRDRPRSIRTADGPGTVRARAARPPGGPDLGEASRYVTRRGGLPAPIVVNRGMGPRRYASKEKF